MKQLSYRGLFFLPVLEHFLRKSQNNGQVDMNLARQLGMQVQGLDVVILPFLINFSVLSNINL
jgi:hypothetical protein